MCNNSKPNTNTTNNTKEDKMYRIAVVDYFNHCDFVIALQNKEDAEKAKEYALAGLSAWYLAPDIDSDELDTNEYFTREEIESFYDLGYAEPTEILLNRDGIIYKTEEMEYIEDEDDADYGEPMFDKYDDYEVY